MSLFVAKNKANIEDNCHGIIRKFKGIYKEAMKIHEEFPDDAKELYLDLINDIDHSKLESSGYDKISLKLLYYSYKNLISLFLEDEKEIDFLYEILVLLETKLYLMDFVLIINEKRLIWERIYKYAQKYSIPRLRILGLYNIIRISMHNENFYNELFKIYYQFLDLDKCCQIVKKSNKYKAISNSKLIYTWIKSYKYESTNGNDFSISKNIENQKEKNEIKGHIIIKSDDIRLFLGDILIKLKKGVNSILGINIQFDLTKDLQKIDIKRKKDPDNVFVDDDLSQGRKSVRLFQKSSKETLENKTLANDPDYNVIDDLDKFYTNKNNIKFNGYGLIEWQSLLEEANVKTWKFVDIDDGNNNLKVSEFIQHQSICYPIQTNELIMNFLIYLSNFNLIDLEFYYKFLNISNQLEILIDNIICNDELNVKKCFKYYKLIIFSLQIILNSREISLKLRKQPLKYHDDFTYLKGILDLFKFMSNDIEKEWSEDIKFIWIHKQWIEIRLIILKDDYFNAIIKLKYLKQKIKKLISNVDDIKTLSKTMDVLLSNMGLSIVIKDLFNLFSKKDYFQISNIAIQESNLIMNRNGHQTNELENVLMIIVDSFSIEISNLYKENYKLKIVYDYITLFSDILITKIYSNIKNVNDLDLTIKNISSLLIYISSISDFIQKNQSTNLQIMRYNLDWSVLVFLQYFSAIYTKPNILKFIKSIGYESSYIILQKFANDCNNPNLKIEFIDLIRKIVFRNKGKYGLIKDNEDIAKRLEYGKNRLFNAIMYIYKDYKSLFFISDIEIAIRQWEIQLLIYPIFDINDQEDLITYRNQILKLKKSIGIYQFITILEYFLNYIYLKLDNVKSQSALSPLDFQLNSNEKILFEIIKSELDEVNSSLFYYNYKLLKLFLSRNLEISNIYMNNISLFIYKSIVSLNHFYNLFNTTNITNISKINILKPCINSGYHMKRYEILKKVYFIAFYLIKCKAYDLNESLESIKNNIRICISDIVYNYNQLNSIECIDLLMCFFNLLKKKFIIALSHNISSVKINKYLAMKLMVIIWIYQIYTELDVLEHKKTYEYYLKVNLSYITNLILKNPLKRVVFKNSEKTSKIYFDLLRFNIYIMKNTIDNDTLKYNLLMSYKKLLYLLIGQSIDMNKLEKQVLKIADMFQKLILETKNNLEYYLHMNYKYITFIYKMYIKNLISKNHLIELFKANFEGDFDIYKFCVSKYREMLNHENCTNQHRYIYRISKICFFDLNEKNQGLMELVRLFNLDIEDKKLFNFSDNNHLQQREYILKYSLLFISYSKYLHNIDYLYNFLLKLQNISTIEYMECIIIINQCTKALLDLIINQIYIDPIEIFTLMTHRYGNMEMDDFYKINAKISLIISKHCKLQLDFNSTEFLGNFGMLICKNPDNIDDFLQHIYAKMFWLFLKQDLNIDDMKDQVHQKTCQNNLIFDKFKSYGPTFIRLLHSQTKERVSIKS